MFSNVQPDHPLYSFFSGLVEQVFMTEIGICDPGLTDYVSCMLVDFVHIDAIYRLRTIDGNAIREVSRMHAEAYMGPDVAESERVRIINQYIGDFTLFWTGVYPESLRAGRRGVNRLDAYLRQGKHCYGVASELSRPEATPPAALLRQLSTQFEYCVHGLRRVREGWEHVTCLPNSN